MHTFPQFLTHIYVYAKRGFFLRWQSSVFAVVAVFNNNKTGVMPKHVTKEHTTSRIEHRSIYRRLTVSKMLFAFHFADVFWQAQKSVCSDLKVVLPQMLDECFYNTVCLSFAMIKNELSDQASVLRLNRFDV